MIKKSLLSSCSLCGHKCLVDRHQGQLGHCKAGLNVGVSSALIHHGEEPPVSGGHLGNKARGSGTVFFTRCTLNCCFCQNWQISQSHYGDELKADELADIFLALAEKKPYNLNLVSPTPYVPIIALALGKAIKQGFDLPVIYNTGGFDSLSALKMMEGLVDIYMPDMKIAPPKNSGQNEPDTVSARLLGAGYYPWVNQLAVNEMFRQVGHLKTNEEKIACQGLLIRHLILPNNLGRTDQLLSYLAETYGSKIHLSLMAQYSPAYHTVNPNHPEFTDFPELNRILKPHEYEAALELALAFNFKHLYIQKL